MVLDIREGRGWEAGRRTRLGGLGMGILFEGKDLKECLGELKPEDRYVYC